jgi:hypothetical protein
VINKTFTASLHPKAKLAEFLGKWRGRPVVPDESIDLAKLIGACCTLVISHQQNLVGRTYASVDAVSKPTKRLVPSGSHDPALARQRIAEWKAKDQAGAAGPQARATSSAASGARPLNPVGAAFAQNPAQPVGSPAPASKSAAPATAPQPDYDPEVGF